MTGSAILIQNIYIWGLLAGIVANAFIAFIAVTGAKIKKLGYIFSGFVLANTVYFISLYFEEVVVTDEAATFWARTDVMGPLLIPLFSSWFAYMYPNRDRLEIPSWKKFLLFVVPILLFLSALTPYNVELQAAGYDGEFIPGPLYYVYLVYGLIYTAWTLVIFRNRRRATEDVSLKRQFNGFFWGLLANNGIMILFSVIIPLISDTFTVSIYLAPFGCFIFSFTVLRSIVQDQLFSAKVVGAELFSGALAFVMFLNLYNSETLTDKITAAVIFGASLVFSVFLIRSVIREVKAREEIATLAEDLSKAHGGLETLNKELQRRVDERTADVRRAFELERKAREELEGLDAAKTRFLLTTQHHLRTPLTVVSGCVSMLANEKAASYSEADVKLLEKVDQQSEKLERLLDEFIAIAQMKEKKGAAYVPVMLADIVERVLAEFKEECVKKGIEMKPDLEGAFKAARVSCDEREFSAALANIIDNAVRYTEKGGKIYVKGARKDGSCMISVKDTGIGITEKEMRHVLVKPFERGEKAAELYTTGRGLGLIVSKNTIEAFGGTLAASSEGRGKGSSFDLVLPLMSE